MPDPDPQPEPEPEPEPQPEPEQPEPVPVPVPEIPVAPVTPVQLPEELTADEMETILSELSALKDSLSAMKSDATTHDSNLKLAANGLHDDHVGMKANLELIKADEEVIKTMITELPSAEEMRGLISADVDTIKENLASMDEGLTSLLRKTHTEISPPNKSKMNHMYQLTIKIYWALNAMENADNLLGTVLHQRDLGDPDWVNTAWWMADIKKTVLLSHEIVHKTRLIIAEFEEIERSIRLVQPVHSLITWQFGKPVTEEAKSKAIEWAYNLEAKTDAILKQFVDYETLFHTIYLDFTNNHNWVHTTSVTIERMKGYVAQLQSLSRSSPDSLLELMEDLKEYNNAWVGITNVSTWAPDKWGVMKDHLILLKNDA